MDAHPTVDLLEQAAQVERYAAFVDGLVTGSIWLVAVVLVGVVLLTYIKGRFDP